MALATADWATMSAEERRHARIDNWRSPGVEFRDADARDAYEKRIARFVDVIDCKQPDRVPFVLPMTFMAADLYGASPRDAMYDPEVLFGTALQFLRDYEPDYYFSPAFVGSGRVLERLGFQQYAWPGHGVSDEYAYQYREDEYMKADEYQALIDDPTDFWLRRYLPRTMNALEPLSRIPPWTDLWEVVGVALHMIAFGAPDVQGALQALMDAGREAAAWAEHLGRFEAEATAAGFVSSVGGATKAPFDLLADTVRGTRATMLDMRRRPELLLQAVERLTPLAIKQGVSGPDATGNPIVFMPLHKGADGFMSDEQFRTLYWPSLKAVVTALVEEGCVPLLFCEGGYNSRLEYLTELPPRSCLCIFDRTEMVRAKEVLGGRVCIAGNVPSGLIMTATPEKVRDFCQELIETVAPGGGYVLSLGTAMDQGRPETIRAVADAARDFGSYS